jgi:hypothetical protein
VIVPFDIKNYETLDGHTDEQLIQGYLDLSMGFTRKDAQVYVAELRRAVLGGFVE